MDTFCHLDPTLWHPTFACCSAGGQVPGAVSIRHFNLDILGQATVSIRCDLKKGVLSYLQPSGYHLQTPFSGALWSFWCDLNRTGGDVAVMWYLRFAVKTQSTCYRELIGENKLAGNHSE